MHPHTRPHTHYYQPADPNSTELKLDEKACDYLTLESEGMGAPIFRLSLSKRPQSNKRFLYSGARLRWYGCQPSPVIFSVGKNIFLFSIFFARKGRHFFHANLFHYIFSIYFHIFFPLSSSDLLASCSNQKSRTSKYTLSLFYRRQTLVVIGFLFVFTSSFIHRYCKLILAVFLFILFSCCFRLSVWQVNCKEGGKGLFFITAHSLL